MNILEIVLLIIGLCLIIGSFFVSERLSSKDRDNLNKLTKEQIEEIIKDKMADAKVEMEDKLSETIDEAMNELDVRTDKETNSKILQISEYSDTVLESVDKSHKEVTFMYSMLNEKQKDTVEISKKLAELQENLIALDAAVTRKIDLLKDQELEIESQKKELEAQRAELEAQKEEPKKEVPFNEALAEKFSDETAEIKPNGNMEILSLHDEGLTEVEIAKKLGRGLGEVKFVLGLYQEAK